jgi:hypothetical protein
MCQTAAFAADILFFSLRQQPAKPVKGFIAPLAIPVALIRSRLVAGPDQAPAVRARDLNLGHHMMLANPGVPAGGGVRPYSPGGQSGIEPSSVTVCPECARRELNPQHPGSRPGLSASWSTSTSEPAGSTDLPASDLRGRRSSIELCRRVLLATLDSNQEKVPGQSRAGLPVFPSGHWYGRRDLNSHCVLFESTVSCRIGLRPRAPREPRSPTTLGKSQVHCQLC